MLPGRGLYVSMQRGLEPRGASRPPVRSEGLRARSPQPGEGDEDTTLGPRPGSFLHRAVDPAMGLGSICMMPAGGSFEHHEAVRQQSVAGLPQYAPGGGSFLLSSECGLLPRGDGSFYAVPSRGDPRLEAMRAAGAPPPAVQATPLPAAPAPGQMLCTAPSVYVATQGMTAPQRNGMCTPTMPASRMAPMVQRQATMGQIIGAANMAPAFVAVHG